jgi:hypothetical protein
MIQAPFSTVQALGQALGWLVGAAFGREFEFMGVGDMEQLIFRN